MNRSPTREDYQRCVQRWQQLKSQYGDDAVNVPEFNRLTKLIRYTQAQFMQRQQMQQNQNLQGQNLQNQNPQNQNMQQQAPQQNLAGAQQPQRHMQNAQFANNNNIRYNQNNLGFQAPPKAPSPQQQYPQQQFMQMGSQMNNVPMGGMGPSSMNNNNMASANMSNANMSNANMSSANPMMNNVAGLNSMALRSPQNMLQMGSMAQNFARGPMMNNAMQPPLDFGDNSPFSQLQLQLIKLQNQAAKLLFKSSNTFAPIPQSLIDMATSERNAFPEAPSTQTPQTPSLNQTAQRQPSQVMPQAAQGQLSSNQSPQVQYQQPPTPSAMLSGVPGAMNAAMQSDAAFQGGRVPQDRQDPKKVAPGKRVPSQYRSTSNTPRAAPAPDPNHVIPVPRSPHLPVPFDEFSKTEDLTDQLIVPVSEPKVYVDTYVLPNPEEHQKVFDFKDLYSAKSKGCWPSLLPYGIDIDEIASTREYYIGVKIEKRKQELEKFISKSSDVSERQFALMELNELALLPYQKLIRGRILSQVWFSKSLLPNSHPNFLAKFPELSVENVILTEELYKQQLNSLAQAQNKRHQENVTKILMFNAKKAELLIRKREKTERLGSKVNSFHAQTAKEEQKKLEKMAKQRLQALKLNDEEAYLKLLDHTKDSRITHLLSQTNQFLDSLAQAVQTQQRESAAKNSMQSEETENTATEPDSEKREKVDYYEVAHRVKEEVTRQPSILVGGTLKEYQLKGLQWMVSLFNNHLNGILADEMGLGKTIQTISLLAFLTEVKRVSGPFLVIVPLSTLTNWNLEFEKWAPSLRKITYKGNPAQRKVMQYDIRQENFEVLLTTFEYIIKDKSLLSKIKWVHMIIDEGHRMKNANSKLSETLTQFYHSDYRLILTGTPLQNNLPELWALLNFVLPKIFNSVKSFDEWFNTPFANTGGQDKIELSEEETLLVIRRLHKVLRPFLLRRLKKDVEKDLPNKVERVVKCKMSSLQSKLYRMMLKYNALFAGDAQNGKKPSTIKNANNQLMQLRKICNHPFVYEEVESLINPTSETNDTIWRTAGKFELLDRILPKFQKTGHRILMFFQMTQIMDIMEDFLRLRGMKYMRLDGGTKSDDRTTLLKLFNAPNSEYFCFLLSTRAGGLGLNLQSADTVVIFDSDWNPHQDLQAQDRAHRIGQKNEVRILRLVTEDSIEEVILERAAAKLEIDGKVIQAGKFDNKSTSEEQEALLRALMDKEEERRLKSAEEDQDLDDDELNQIIARNTDELDVFRALDSERIRETIASDYSTRLFSDQELPEIYKIDPQSIYKTEEQIIEEYGRGNRERKIAVYDDNLTEEEWLKRIEGMASEDSEEEVVVKKKGRPRKIDVAKRDSAGLDFEDHPLLKRPRSTTPSARGKKARSGRPRLKSAANRSTPTVDLLSAEERATLQARMESIFDELLEFKDEGRKLLVLFMVKPSKKQYPDYYMLIKHPLAFDAIRKRIDQRKYTGIRDFMEDVHLIFSNARIYNEEGSIVYRDATVLENLAIECYKKEFANETDEWAQVLDFRSFDEAHLLKPLPISGASIKAPVKEPSPVPMSVEEMMGADVAGMDVDHDAIHDAMMLDGPDM